jgi:sec-independent protein translocase protein TatA
MRALTQKSRPIAWPGPTQAYKPLLAGAHGDIDNRLEDPMSFGGPELMIVLVIVIIVFGSTKLPQLGDGLGRAIKNFKRATSGGNEIDVTPGAKKTELNEDATEKGPNKASG